jgi:hypothetical protein
MVAINKTSSSISQRSIVIGLVIFVAICEVVRMTSLYSSYTSEDILSSMFVTSSSIAAVYDTAASSSQPQGAVAQSYQLALKESFGFFDDISDQSWQYRQSLARKRQDHTLPLEKSLHENRPAFWYVNNYYPSFSCPHLWRVGGAGDGPKYLCDVHRLPKQPSCLVYSVGSKAKFEFEDGLIAEIGHEACEIHVFDPRPLPAGMAETLASTKNIHFHKWGLGSSYDEKFNPRKPGIKRGNFRTLNETMTELGHTGKTIDVFKIDCEGCEWATYKDWLAVDIRQLLVETHDLAAAGPEASSDFFDDLIDAGFNVISREPNIFPFVTKNNNMALEWSLIRLDPAFSGGRTNRTAVR